MIHLEMPLEPVADSQKPLVGRALADWVVVFPKGECQGALGEASGERWPAQYAPYPLDLASKSSVHAIDNAALQERFKDNG